MPRSARRGACYFPRDPCSPSWTSSRLPAHFLGRGRPSQGDLRIQYGTLIALDRPCVDGHTAVTMTVRRLSKLKGDQVTTFQMTSMSADLECCAMFVMTVMFTIGNPLKEVCAIIPRGQGSGEAACGAGASVCLPNSRRLCGNPTIDQTDLSLAEASLASLGLTRQTPARHPGMTELAAARRFPADSFSARRHRFSCALHPAGGGRGWITWSHHKDVAA